jgi:hypothetical protein
MTDEPCHLRLKDYEGTGRYSLALRPHAAKEKSDRTESEAVKINETFVRVIHFNTNEVRNKTDRKKFPPPTLWEKPYNS